MAKILRNFFSENTDPKGKVFNEGYSSQLTEALNKWDRTSDNQGIIINAAWGVGKTTFVNAFLEKRKENKTLSRKKKNIDYIYLQMAQLSHNQDLLEDITHSLFKQKPFKYSWHSICFFLKSYIIPMVLYGIVSIICFSSFYLATKFFLLFMESVFSINLPFMQYAAQVIVFVGPLLGLYILSVKSSRTLQKRNVISSFVKKHPIILIIDEVDTIPQDNFVSFIDSFRSILNISGIFYIFLWNPRIIKRYFERLYPPDQKNQTLQSYYDHFCAKNTSSKPIPLSSTSILEGYIRSHEISEKYPLYKDLLLSAVEYLINEKEAVLKNFRDKSIRGQKRIIRDHGYKEFLPRRDLMDFFTFGYYSESKPIFPVDMDGNNIDINQTYYLTLDALLQLRSDNDEEYNEDAIKSDLALIEYSHQDNKRMGTLLKNSYHSFVHTHESRMNYFQKLCQETIEDDYDIFSRCLLFIENYYNIWATFLKQNNGSWLKFLNHLYPPHQREAKIPENNMNVLLLDGGLALTVVADISSEDFASGYLEYLLKNEDYGPLVFEPIKRLPKKLQLLFLYYFSILSRPQATPTLFESRVYGVLSNIIDGTLSHEDIFQNKVYKREMALMIRSCFDTDEINNIITYSGDSSLAGYPEPYLEYLREIESRVKDFYEEI